MLTHNDTKHKTDHPDDCAPDLSWKAWLSAVLFFLVFLSVLYIAEVLI